MRRQRLLLAAVPLSVLALVATACGGSSGGGGGAPKAGKAEFNGALNALVNPSTAKGGTLQMATVGDCDYWDPARTYYAFCWNMQRFISRGLMAYKAVPGPDGASVVPDLAEEAGKPTDGNKTWTYKIKKGLKLENGEAITSKLIKYGVERIFAGDVINGGPTYFVTFLCPGKTDKTGACPTYAGPYKDKAADKLGLSTIETPDDNTIIFKLNQPFGDFNYLAAMPGTTPVPIAYDQNTKTGGAKYTFKPVASGPYKVGPYSPGKKITLVRNTNWDAASDPFRKALPDSVVLTINSNAQDVDNRIVAGTVDLDPGGTGVQVATQQKVLRDLNLKNRADNPFTGFTRYFAINVNVPPFNNVECRKAVEYAVNKVDIQTARGGPIGGGAVATTMLNPNIQGYTSFDLYPNGADHRGDLAKAREALTNCGKPNGFSTKLTTTNAGKGPPVAEALQNALKRVGIKVTIEAGDPASYYSQFIGAPATNKSKGFGIMVAGWGADFPTGYGFFSQIVDGRAIKAQGNSNYAELNSQKVNGLIDQANAATSATDAAKLWGDVDKAVMEEAAEVPYLYDKALLLHSSRLKNIYVTAAFGMYDYQALGVL
ncbi:MAG: peptide/nickel transport system substrate-binding protein [Frankiales bacterium]|jgi:peptide/nickel transport system substrate-binding protein|nr:peptide/nickel transport system substrate-binding protein [Frankiales bacterium]